MADVKLYPRYQTYIKLAAGCRLPVADSKDKVSSGLPVAGCRLSCRLPVADSKN